MNFSLLADRITPMKTMGKRPYTMVYGTPTILPIHLQIPTLRLAIYEAKDDFQPLQHHLDTLIKVELRGVHKRHVPTPQK
jgi:hypothetical protein